MKSYPCWAVVLALCGIGSLPAQVPLAPGTQADTPAATTMQPATMASGAATPLAALIAEAEAANPQIAAADHTYQAATKVSRQVTTLPDPTLTLQSFSVGNPLPGAGFNTSDFAYIGIGASQQLPYPGKLRLKGEAADRAADAELARVELLRASVAEQVKLDYLQLAYKQATLDILSRNDRVLQQLIADSLSRYSLGQGTQADVLKAQIEHTKLLREITGHHQDMGQLQADLKQLLHRDQTSPEIVTEPLAATPIQTTAAALQALVVQHNPNVAVDQKLIAANSSQVASAERERKPDFDVAYMFQQTGPGYSDYYMATLNLRLPRRKRVEAEVAEASEKLASARKQLDAQLQMQLAEVAKQYVTVTSTNELIAEYRDGLLPQAQAILNSEQTSYQSGSQPFAPVLTSLLDLLTYEHDYQQAILDHETALAKLETLTGATLR